MYKVNYDQLVTFLNQFFTNEEEVTRLKKEYELYTQTGNWQDSYQIITSGWQNLNGIMLMRKVDNLDADFQVFLSATTERSLRELLLAFPRKTVGMFHITGDWIVKRIQHLFDGDIIDSGSYKYFHGVKRGSHQTAEQRTVTKRKDEIATNMRKLNSVKGKIENHKFIVEGEMIVDRAIADGLAVESVLYTSNYIQTSQNVNSIKRISDENISHYLVNDGIMGSITTTRPVPSIVASVYLPYQNFITETGLMNFHQNSDCTLLIVENIANPDNLGMTLRTADAAGVSAVLLSGDGASPFHKNCVRASRGTVGRLPLFYTTNSYLAIQKLKDSGWTVLGATANTENELYKQRFTPPVAIVVGNENRGLLSQTCNACTELVRIPMSKGQSSLNVGVAAGVFLYEIARQKINNKENLSI